MKLPLTDYRLEVERHAFLGTRNPMHAWVAYGIARRGGRNVPDWVLEYLDKAQLGLVFNIPDAIERQGSGKDLGPHIARAFGLVKTGRGNPFEFDDKWWRYGRLVRRLTTKGKEGQERGGAMSLFHATQEAAEVFGVKRKVIEYASKVYEKAFPDGVEEPQLDENDLPDF